MLAMSCTNGPPKCPVEGGAQWRELESDHFRLVTDLDAHVAESELHRFERSYDAMMQAAFPRGATGRMRLVVFRTNDELRAFAPNAAAGLFVDGWAMEDDETGTALFGSGLREESRAVFQHELAHRFLAAGFAEVPPWFSEGLAVYFETMRVEGDRVILGDWARPNTPLPSSIRRLTVLDRDGFYLGADRRDVSDEDASRVGLRYVASWHLVHLLRNGPDSIRNEFRRVVRTVNDGGAFEPAFDAFVQEVGAQELDRAFIAHSQDTERLSSVFAYTPTPLRARPKARDLSPEETHLLFAKLLIRGQAPHQALPEVDEALRHAPRSLNARLARAHVQLVRGDVQGARNAFAAIVAEAPANGAALAGMLHALLETQEAAPTGPDAERLRDLATRLSSVASTADEHSMAIVGLATTGDFERALLASEAAVRAHPTSFRLLAARAKLLAHEGRYRDATVAMRRALEVMPERRARGPEGRDLARRLADYRARAEQAEQAERAEPAH